MAASTKPFKSGLDFMGYSLKRDLMRWKLGAKSTSRKLAMHAEATALLGPFNYNLRISI